MTKDALFPLAYNAKSTEKFTSRLFAIKLSGGKEIIIKKAFEIPEEEFTVPLGLGEVKRSGTDISIITYSYMVHTALSAADILGKESIDAEVVDLRTLRPMDTKTVMSSVRKTHRVVILHEACVTGGIGGEIAARIADEAFDFIDAPVKRLGVPDVPIPYSKSLENAIVPNEEKLITCIKNVLAGI